MFVQWNPRLFMNAVVKHSLKYLTTPSAKTKRSNKKSGLFIDLVCFNSFIVRWSLKARKDSCQSGHVGERLAVHCTCSTILSMKNCYILSFRLLYMYIR